MLKSTAHVQRASPVAKAKPPIAPIKAERSKRTAAVAKRTVDAKSNQKAPKPRAKKPKAIAQAPAPAPAKARAKLERGRFALPLADFNRLAELKVRAGVLGRPTKKNELFRAGLRLLSTLSDESLVIALDQLEPTRKKARRKSDLDNRDN